MRIPHIHFLTAVIFATATPALAQVTILNGNHGVNGRLCVGPNCESNDALGTFELTLKNTLPGIKFEDTSTTGSQKDWELEANQSSFETFSLIDMDTDRRVLVVEGDAPANALYLSDNGQIGLQTSLPKGDLHILDGGLANLILEDSLNGSEWDVNVGVAGFFIDDRTNNTFPFGIENGAPSNRFRIASNGRVGIGTTVPAVPFHVVEAAGTATDVMRLENNGGVVFRLKDTSPGGQEFTFQSNGGIFRIASPAVPGPEFTMDDFGNVTIKGEITTAGSCSAGCDRVFDEGYELADMGAHHAAMWANGYLPNVGPTAEDGPMNLSEKVGGMLNELEHAHIYIDQLNTHIAKQDAIITTLISRVEALENQ